MSIKWLVLNSLLLLALTPTFAKDYVPDAIRLIATGEPICFYVSVRERCRPYTHEEAMEYNDIERKILSDITKFAFLYDMPIITNKESRDCSKYDIVLSYIFSYDECSFSIKSGEIPCLSSLSLAVKPKAFVPPSSPLAKLDYVLIWEDGIDIDLITSTDNIFIYSKAGEDLQRYLETFALFYKRAIDRAR